MGTSDHVATTWTNRSDVIMWDSATALYQCGAGGRRLDVASAFVRHVQELGADAREHGFPSRDAPPLWRSGAYPTMTKRSHVAPNFTKE